MENQGRASVEKIRCHLKPVRAFFDGRPAMDVTTAALERYQRQRLDAKKAPATVNREVHALRRAFNVAAHQTPPLFPKHLVPYFPSLPVDNVCSGFFERREVEALLEHVDDDGIRDFIAWGFRTGMRKGEIARLTWDMLDRSGTPWVLRIPAAITKNRTGRTLGFEGEVRAIVERRLKVRRFDTLLIFHRVRKGKRDLYLKDQGALDEFLVGNAVDGLEIVASGAQTGIAGQPLYRLAQRLKRFRAVLSNIDKRCDARIVAALLRSSGLGRDDLRETKKVAEAADELRAYLKQRYPDLFPLTLSTPRDTEHGTSRIEVVPRAYGE